MKKLAAWSLWLDGCIWGAVSALGTPHMAHAAPPPDVVIASADEAHAFSDSEPFVFSGQTLSVQNSFSTGRDIQLTRLAPVIVGPGVHFELKGRVSSTGAPLGSPLEKRGPGTLQLTGENTYTSNTVLREGVLRLGGGSALGDSLYSLEQHGGTVLHLEAGARLENFIQLVETRPGDEPLPGLEGMAQWRVDAGTATLGNSVNALLPVHKTGDGTLRLAGVVQGHSSLFVEAGALAVESAAAARVGIGAGARLEGNGELAHLHVHAGGMVAPGGRDLPGTLSVWGGAVFDADSLYHVNTYPDGRADLLRVGGQAALDGHVQAQAGDGNWAREHRYLILSADGGLNGTNFAGVQTDLAFLDPALEYEDRSVYLMLRRNDLEPGDVAQTPDEKEVGDAITPPDRPRRPRRPRVPVVPVPPAEPAEPTEPVQENEEPAVSELPEPEPPVPEQPDAESPEPAPVEEESSSQETDVPTADVQRPTPLEEAMQGMSVEQVRSMLRQSSGSWHASVRSFLMEDGRHVRQAVLASGRGAWGRHGAARWNGQDMNGAYETVQHSGSEAGLRTWAQTYSATGRRQAVDSVDGDRHSSHGIVLGLDAPTARHWRLGLACRHGPPAAGSPPGPSSAGRLRRDARRSVETKTPSRHSSVRSAMAPSWRGRRFKTANNGYFEVTGLMRRSMPTG